MNKKVANFSLVLLICVVFLCFSYYFTHDIPIAEVISGNTDDVVVKWILPPTYYDGTDFSEGRAWVQECEGDTWTLIDEEGNILRKNFETEEILGYHDSFAFFDGARDLSNGFVNLSGDVVFSSKEKILDPHAGNGLIAIKGKNNLCGFVDMNHEWAIQPIYEQILYFSEGLAPVRKDGKWGFIDSSGSIAIDFKFEFVYPFSHGISVFKAGNMFGLINKNGEIIADPIYEAHAAFWSELIAMQKEGKVGFIDGSGNVVIDFQYIGVEEGWWFLGMEYYFFNDVASVYLDKTMRKHGFINRSGDMVFTLDTGQDIVQQPGRSIMFSLGFRSDYYPHRDETDDEWELIDTRGHRYKLPPELNAFYAIVPSDGKVFRAEGKFHENIRTGYFVITND